MMGRKQKTREISSFNSWPQSQLITGACTEMCGLRRIELLVDLETGREMNPKIQNTAIWTRSQCSSYRVQVLDRDWLARSRGLRGSGTFLGVGSRFISKPGSMIFSRDSMGSKTLSMTKEIPVNIRANVKIEI
jgi:hypothetical protein